MWEVTITGAAVTINNTSHGSVSYGYNAAGNLTTKSDYGSHYQYGNVGKTAGGNAGPNALRQLTRGSDIINLTYDNAGNLTGGDGMSITYDGNNHTTSVTRDGAHLTFEYDAAGQRFRQVKTKDGQTTVTHYIGNVEKVLESGSKTSEVYRIDIGGHTIINKVISGTINAPQISYVLRDRLGSVSVVVSGDGTSPVVWERRDYDAFGKPVDLPNHTLPPEFTVTQRGFTGHEHLSDVELIHMNGRAYDYNTGRFLSVDPFIQGAANSQSINPYSYILNNPLSGTDPSGYRRREMPANEGGAAPDNNDGTNPVVDISSEGFVSAEVFADGTVIVTTTEGTYKVVSETVVKSGGVSQPKTTKVPAGTFVVGKPQKAQNNSGESNSDNGGNSGRQSYSPNITGTIEPIVGSPTKGFLKSLVNMMTFGIVYGNISSIPSLNADPLDTADLEAYSEITGINGELLSAASPTGVSSRLAKLGQSELKAIRKINNIRTHALKDKDFAGTITEMLDVLPSKLGDKLWNHVKEMNDSLRGLRNHSETLKGVNHPEAKEALHNAQSAINRIEETIKGHGI